MVGATYAILNTVQAQVNGSKGISVQKTVIGNDADLKPIDELHEYSERYGVEVVIDTKPVGVINK